MKANSTKAAGGAPREDANLSNGDANERYLPPRRVLHPSNQGRMLRVFYGGLFLGFVALVVGLTLWGMQRNH